MLCYFVFSTGLPHTQGTEGIFKLKKSQGNSGNINLFFKLRKTQGSYDFFYKTQGSFKILKSQEIFLLDLE